VTSTWWLWASLQVKQPGDGKLQYSICIVK
jgi:hypothetical protein